MPKLDKTRPRKLNGRQRVSEPTLYSVPGCCDRAGMLIHFNGSQWVHSPEPGAPGPTDDLLIRYCPFCGTRLSPIYPARRR